MFLSSARRVSASKRAVPAFKQAIIGGDGGSGSGEEGEERERRSVLSSEAPEYFPRGGAISSCFVPQQQAPQPMMMPMMHQGPVMVPMYTMYAWAPPYAQFYRWFLLLLFGLPPAAVVQGRGAEGM